MTDEDVQITYVSETRWLDAVRSIDEQRAQIEVLQEQIRQLRKYADADAVVIVDTLFAELPITDEDRLVTVLERMNASLSDPLPLPERAFEVTWTEVHQVAIFRKEQVMATSRFAAADLVRDDPDAYAVDGTDLIALMNVAIQDHGDVERVDLYDVDAERART